MRAHIVTHTPQYSTIPGQRICRPMRRRSGDPLNSFNTGTGFVLDFRYYDLVESCLAPRCFAATSTQGLASGGEIGFIADVTLAECGGHCERLAHCIGIQYRAQTGGCRPMLQRSADPVNVFNIGFPFEREFQYFDRVNDCETQICYEKSGTVGLVQGNELRFLQQTTLELCATQCSIREECRGFQFRLEGRSCRLMSSRSDNPNAVFETDSEYKTGFMFHDRAPFCNDPRTSCNSFPLLNRREPRCTGCRKGARRTKKCQDSIPI